MTPQSTLMQDLKNDCLIFKEATFLKNTISHVIVIENMKF